MPMLRHHRRHAVATRRGVTALLIALVFFAPVTNAGVYKCAGEKGTFIYQEDPCPEGKELRNFDLDPPTLSVIPGVSAPAAPPVKSVPDKTAKQTTLDRSDKNRGKVDGDATARKFIHVGMKEAEVLARIGRPDMTAGGSRTNRTRWSYLPHANDPDTITTITFSGDTVSDVSRKLVKR